MSDPHRTHPYGRSADDVRRRDLRARRTRRFRITQIAVFSVAAVLLLGVGAYAIGQLRTPNPAPGVIATKTFGRAEPEVTCPEAGAVPAAPEDVTVNVLNGTGRSGLAGRVSESLADRGYTAGKVGNTSQASGAAVIVYGPSGYLAAQSVLAQVGTAELTLDGRDDASVDLLLGDGFSDLAGSGAAEKALGTPVATPEGCG